MVQVVSFMVKIALGFGSNLGDRKKSIYKALELLVAMGVIENVNLSRFLETKALLLPSSPPEWNLDYINCVATANCDISADQLLEVVKKVETQVGRSSNLKWAPREIDIDILVYGEEYIEGLAPHYGLLEREFAISLLADLWPEWKYPVPGDNYLKTAKELSKNI